MARNTKSKTPATVTPVTLSIAPNAAANNSQPKVNLGKYAKAATAQGIGTMGSAGSAKFTLGQWPRSVAAPTAPIAGKPLGKATVAQALYMAAQAAGATQNNAVTGLQIGQAVLQPGSAANQALLTTVAAQRVIKGQQYAKGGQAAGLWLAGYIGPHKSAACIATKALKVAS